MGTRGHPRTLRDWLPGGCALSVLAAAMFGLSAQAQPAASESGAAPAAPRAFGLTTGLGLDGSVIDVRGRASGANGREVLVSASPSLTLFQRGGRLQGSLIYGGALSSRRGIDDREETEYSNSLSAAFVLEAIDGIGFVDARASITQQSISAVGAPADSLSTSANRTEVTTVSVSPYLRGTLGGYAEFEGRLAGTVTEGGNDAVSDSKTAQGSFYVRSPRRGSLFGWGLSGARQVVKFSTASTYTITDRAAAELIFQPDIDWRLTVTGGQERTDVVGAQRRAYENYGAGLQWTPSPRTTVALQGEERYFGRAHRLSVEHRMQRSSLRYADSRDAISGVDTLAQGQPVTLYELYFAQFASQFPDPVQRDQFVLALIQALGRNRNDVVIGGLAGAGGIAVLRRRELFWTWAGPRLTMSLSGFSVDSERADTGGVNPAGLNDNTGQTGYAASLGWRLTPLASLNASGSRSMSKDNVTLARSDLKSVTVGLTSQLGARMSGTLGARYSVLNGAADSYRETALTGSLSLRF